MALKRAWGFGIILWHMQLALAFVLLLAAFALPSCTDAGASPKQPIDFPHRSHTENQIDCVFCHEFVEDNASAGIPQTELCGTCHMAMAQDSEATQTLMEYVESNEPIPWVPLYELPDYSVFPHKWHVRAEVACEECHGSIGDSLTATRHVVPDMEWCLDCHEQRGATEDCVACHK